ncbi:hypothetical protein OUZ56_007174 [Daphnia magna]|uniref:Uncharacterized protein n=1 Tax=Daphnia magna TaxID=35525 RepID=A0ABQ9YXT7_9CRUS|nr:hypothetical protein OUZ56_007174 [Daphnia magna]
MSERITNVRMKIPDIILSCSCKESGKDCPLKCKLEWFGPVLISSAALLNEVLVSDEISIILLVYRFALRLSYHK